ncbi:hypothetical protein Tco_1347094 [Tanacetum coccineum]
MFRRRYIYLCDIEIASRHLSLRVPTPRALVDAGLIVTSGDARSWYMISGDAKSWVVKEMNYMSNLVDDVLLRKCLYIRDCGRLRNMYLSFHHELISMDHEHEVLNLDSAGNEGLKQHVLVEDRKEEDWSVFQTEKSRQASLLVYESGMYGSFDRGLMGRNVIRSYWAMNPASMPMLVMVIFKKTIESVIKKEDMVERKSHGALDLGSTSTAVMFEGLEVNPVAMLEFKSGL